jgi:nicotinamidase-related amidase
MTRDLPLPSFFATENASKWAYRADPAALTSAAEEWSRRFSIRGAATDNLKLHLLLIDAQKDFCFPEGSLYVAGRSGRGAIDDNDRTARFIYRNLRHITEITTTLDTHFAYQIFSPMFWLTKDGAHPQPFRFVTSDEVRSGELRPNPRVAALYTGGNYPWLLDYVTHYCTQLEKSGKYQLYLWPYHCLLGGDGHALVPIIHEARLFHAFVRGSQTMSEVKGGSPFTENYSVLSPEVLLTHDGRTVGQRNTEFIKKLLDSDAVVIAGQAASHCVKSSIDDLLDQIVAHDAKLASKVFIMTDCMSAVTVPDGKGGFVADFTPQAQQAFDRFANAGMHLVKSTDPIESWMRVN